ncbi:hypothetical protein KRP22_014541 [Phytophthora ramorum]|nr:hypothetical protein KRP22_8856 [Phytophthora ramorum]
MPSEEEFLDAVSLDFGLPSSLAAMDDTNEPESSHVANLSNSLEPAELDLELAGASSDVMDESFQAAMQLLDESFGTGIHSESEFSPQVSDPMIKSIDTPCISAEESSASIANGLPSPKDAVASKPRLRHRVSTKQQISKLRGTVEELSEQLESLRSGPSQAEAVGRGAPFRLDSSEVGSTDPLWQQIATRQLERRREAERDNAKLRAMLDLQVQEAKNLKRVLKRRTRIEMLEDMLGVKRHKIMAETKPNDSLHVLQEMLRSTDDIFAEVDSDFTNKGMDQVPCPGKTRTANRHATNGTMLEIMEKQIVPFKAKMTEKAVASALGQIAMQPLQCVKVVDVQVDFYAQNSQQSDDTMMISYTVMTAGFHRADMRLVRIRKVMRKYVEVDRTVFICRISAKSQLASRKEGVELRSVIRVVVEKANMLQGNQDDTTLIKSYYSVTRHVPVKEEFWLHTDVDLAIAAWDESIARVSGEVESFMLDAKMSSTTTTESN